MFLSVFQISTSVSQVWAMSAVLWPLAGTSMAPTNVCVTLDIKAQDLSALVSCLFLLHIVLQTQVLNSGFSKRIECFFKLNICHTQC